ncbi:MAG TPA: hypothetical protein VM487_06175 [Phycisphaerae bacterium]|nr:hypothetical protein [Phycisphaerae bacterium]
MNEPTECVLCIGDTPVRDIMAGLRNACLLELADHTHHGGPDAIFLELRIACLGGETFAWDKTVNAAPVLPVPPDNCRQRLGKTRSRVTGARKDEP